MRSYFAAQGKRTYTGGWQAVLSWATEQAKKDPVPVKIIKARPGERQGRVVAEVTQEGIRAIRDGRQVSVRSLSGKA